MFGGSFAPAGWAFCNGALMPISENDTLFNLIGTTYGGDGQETFGLPNLSGRVPVHQGQGPGLSQSYIIGQLGGVESVTLTVNQIPSHSHAMIASGDPANQGGAANAVLATPPSVAPFFAATPDSSLNASTVQPQGGSQPHENMQPFLTISFILSLYGVYPTPT
jgi:microcystin-dependent protein